MWRVLWQTEAVAELMDVTRSNPRQAARIQSAVEQFQRTGSGNLKALRGRPGELRLRVGDWRVILHRDSRAAEPIVVVIEVKIRSEAYE